MWSLPLTSICARTATATPSSELAAEASAAGTGTAGAAAPWNECAGKVQCRRCNGLDGKVQCSQCNGLGGKVQCRRCNGFAPGGWAAAAVLACMSKAWSVAGGILRSAFPFMLTLLCCAACAVLQGG